VIDVANIRKSIPVCQRMVYLNTGWSGPSPVQVVEAIKARLDYEMEQGPTGAEVIKSAQEIREDARQRVAALLNASPDEICLTKNTTDGLNIVINGLPWQEGDEIITCSLEHSSVLVPSYFTQSRHGVKMRVLPMASNEPREDILSKIEGAINDRTKLVFLSHIEYSSGLRMPVNEIRSMTRDRGIWMLLDGAQTAGHISLDMRDIDCEFYSIPGQKWLLGSEGVGALYIRQDMIPTVAPTQVGGRAVVHYEEPVGLEPNTDSMDKFLVSSTSTALQAGLAEAVKFIQDAGVAAIEERNLDLASSLKAALSDIPRVTVGSPMDRQSSSGLVTLNIDGVSPESLVSYLWEQHRIVARRVEYPPSVRVSLHFFNTEEEVDALAAAVRQRAEAD
jgi:L-cysteine/cystine lyase